jgi:hypothetical protein
MVCSENMLAHLMIGPVYTAMHVTIEYISLVQLTCLLGGQVAPFSRPS